MSDNEKVVIVCEHVASGRSPILFAQRCIPMDSDDSGWQLSCGMEGGDDESKARAWRIHQVLAVDPGMVQLLQHPPGTCWRRQRVESCWEKL